MDFIKIFLILNLEFIKLIVYFILLPIALKKSIIGLNILAIKPNILSGRLVTKFFAFVYASDMKSLTELNTENEEYIISEINSFHRRKN